GVGADVGRQVQAACLQLPARAALDAGDVGVGAGDALADGVGEQVGHVGGRCGDDRQVDRAVRGLVGAGAEGGRGAGLLRVVVGQVHGDAAPGEGEGGGGADE